MPEVSQTDTNSPPAFRRVGVPCCPQSSEAHASSSKPAATVLDSRTSDNIAEDTNTESTTASKRRPIICLFTGVSDDQPIWAFVEVCARGLPQQSAADVSATVMAAAHRELEQSALDFRAEVDAGRVLMRHEDWSATVTQLAERLDADTTEPWTSWTVVSGGSMGVISREQYEGMKEGDYGDLIHCCM